AETMEYEDRGKLKTAAVEEAKPHKGTKEKIKRLISQKGDKASDFLGDILKLRLLYSAELLGDVGDNVTELANAVKCVFCWKIGPFETWDSIGVQESNERMKEDGEKHPEWLEKFIADGNESFYKEENNKVFYYDAGEYKEIDFNPKEIHI